MKKLVPIVAVCISFLSYGQAPAETVTLASNKLTVPTGCIVESELKVHCDNYKVEWLYGDKQKVKGLQDAFLEVGRMLDKFEKKHFDFYLFETKVKGYKVSYQIGTGTTFQLTASGVVNNEPVWVLVSLDKEPITNDDLPQFVRQIIRFSEKK